MSVISVKDVEKKFKVFFDKGQSFKERILFRNRNHYEDRWVLKGISFEVEKGEAIGLIGENGCGKSTLLKLMTKIMYPDRGSIELKGRVSSLIELGAGFHPDMSGRENIYTNAAIFGLTKKEIDTRIKKIIRFSELEEFIDNPVRTYSSGMYMRLAFSVAINVDADILLIDEILAVGDAAFQAKCFNKLREIKSSGTTIAIVSHSLGQIEQICDRSIWINDGKIQMQGSPRAVHPNYMEFMGEKVQEVEQANDDFNIEPEQEAQLGAAEESARTETVADEAESSPEPVSEPTRWGSREAQIVKVSSFNEKGKRTTVFSTGEAATFCVDYVAKKKIEQAVFGVGFIRNDDVYCYGTNTTIDRMEDITIEASGAIRLNISKLNLLPGVYNMEIAIERFPGIPLDFYKKAYQIEVHSNIGDIGAVRLDHTWELT